MEQTQKKAYALGIIGRELNIDFDSDISQETANDLSALADDALLDEPKSEVGKKMKGIIEAEKVDAESEYNKGFNFHTDLNKNKIMPATVFVFQIFGKYAEKLASKEDIEGTRTEMLNELVSKLNELEYPVGYFDDPFNHLLPEVSKLLTALKGQVEHREEELKAMSVGVKHPKYGTLSPHLGSLKQYDDAIKNLRETFGFTEEDYRSK